MQRLITHIRQFVTLSDDEALLLQNYLSIRQLKKKEIIFQEGQVCRANYFILKGCMRTYLITPSNTEQVIQFGIDNWWITDYDSLDRQEPSRLSLQALEVSEVAVLDRSAQDELFEKLPQLERYFRLLLQRAYSASLTRLHYVLNLPAEERYRNFNRLFPGFVQRVPQYMLASYLGFSAELLSKFRAKKE